MAGNTPFVPVIDGDFIATHPTDQLNAGTFVKVPLLIGTNSDEGSIFGTYGIQNDAEFTAAVNSTTFPSTLSSYINNAIAYLYPDVQAIGVPSLETYPDLLSPNNPLVATLGRQARRSFAFFGDLIFHAPRRAANTAWSNSGVPSYSYCFDVTPANVPTYLGARHFAEVAFVFDTTDLNFYDGAPFPNATEPEKRNAYVNVASFMSRSWVGFIARGNPNANGFANVSAWEVYNATMGGGVGRNMVLTAVGEGLSSYVEDDTFREEGISFLTQHAKSVWGR
ncbi:hypothetical protein BP6252_11401 [Coleophoma cylindrospora]|uniref:Carboxylesterase type B domain-containing protein n=1 Tax=Coleophoma cylindrospora TaxID=1849047 RepID=A0A3D8QJS8_9HELO|nr:hypothetical protein BP6252_11401 [Coleophoma cylindrospora]